MIEATINYGNIKDGRYYQILGEYSDYYSIKVQGKVMNTPKWVFTPVDRRKQREEEEFEEEWEQ